MDKLTEQGYYPYSYAPTKVFLEKPSLRELVAKARELIAPIRFRLAARDITRELEIKENSKILELGSGLGLLGEAIKSETGGDISYFGVELFLTSAKQGLDRGLISFQADLQRLPFADGSFDYIVTTDVLEHVNDSEIAAKEMFRVLKSGGKAFVVIADPSEARFDFVEGHIKRSNENSDVSYWENLFMKVGFEVKPENSEKYRRRDWRRIFNLPFLVKLKNKPGFACAFNPINRPGVYILEKPISKTN